MYCKRRYEVAGALVDAVLLLMTCSHICRVSLLVRCSGLELDMYSACYRVSSHGLLHGDTLTGSATYSSSPILNILFAVFFGLTTYFYIYSMVEDPGFVPKLGSRSQQQAAIIQLFEEWKFDEENFCVFCMIRRPLRSKHCRRCGRCVAKHDQ